MALTLNKQNFTFTGKSLNITAEKNKLLEPYDKQIWNFGIVLALMPNDKQKEQSRKKFRKNEKNKNRRKKLFQ